LDTGFAIDELYSAGWWPGESEPCLRASDGRWYPDSAACAALFERFGWTVVLQTIHKDRCVRVAWTARTGARGAVLAADETSARIMALASLWRSETNRSRPPVDRMGVTDTVPTCPRPIGPIV
jgi:hypothetical protein